MLISNTDFPYLIISGHAIASVVEIFHLIRLELYKQGKCRIKEKHFNTHATNKFYNEKKTNKANKNNFNKIKDNIKEKDTSINNNYSTITKDNKKMKNKKIAIEQNKIKNKKIHFKKNNGKLPNNSNNPKVIRQYHSP